MASRSIHSTTSRRRRSSSARAAGRARRNYGWRNREGAHDNVQSTAPSVLPLVEPIFERADTANGVFYRVQVGPFASQEAAESLCEQLKQRNASCFVIRR